MGGGFYSDDSYSRLKKSYTTKSTDDIFVHTKTRTMSNKMDPKKLVVRESRDSDDHPQSLAIAIFLDVTGSMGKIPAIIAKEKLGNLMKVLIDNGVHDAHVMFSGIGDHHVDDFPLQVGQYEAETTKLDHWLTSINLEGGGGGQHQESYLMAWLVAGRHTSIDCFEKRGKKGFLFTIGDESSWNKISADHLKQWMGYEQAEEVTDVQLLQEAQRTYEVFHIHCQQGAYRDHKDILNYWKDLLGERLLKLDDYNNICEVIATMVATMSGADLDTVVGSMDKSTAIMVKDTISNTLDKVRNVNHSGVITL
jgi:hypothetical protein